MEHIGQYFHRACTWFLQDDFAHGRLVPMSSEKDTLRCLLAAGAYVYLRRESSC